MKEYRLSGRQILKYRGLNLTKYALRRAVTSGHRSPKVRLLLASDLRSYTSEQQFAPFVRYAEQLRQAYGLEVLQTDIFAAIELLNSGICNFDIIGLKLSFLTTPAEANNIVRRIAGLKDQARLVYFDGDDDLCVQFTEIPALCDLYIKKHAFVDRTRYGNPTIGKSNLTDYVHRQFGISFQDDPIPHSPGLEERDWTKIRVLANIAEDDKINELYRRIPTFPAGDRPYDIVCRATVNEKSWIFPLRNRVSSTLEPLSENFNLLMPTSRVPQSQYYEEMLSSKLCVSPFGYGEICWRDFETILCGAVLVKPDMSHIETYPNIFVPGETYLPVRWDLSDLPETCEAVLASPTLCQSIARNAHERLTSFLAEQQFIKRVGPLLRELRNL